MVLSSPFILMQIPGIELRLLGFCQSLVPSLVFFNVEIEDIKVVNMSCIGILDPK